MPADHITTDAQAAIDSVLARNPEAIQPRDPNRAEPSFRTYLGQKEREQLDAEAACANQERDDALDELREERVKTGRLEGELRSQDRAIRELTAQLDRTRTELEQVREAAHRRDLGINAERTQWQAEIAHLRSLIADRHDWETIPVEDIRKALRDGPPAGLGSPSPRAQDEPDSDARRLLDQAIAGALPLAGGRVAELLDALRRELVRVDAKRAEREG